MTEVIVKLPDELAQRAKRAGLLTDSAIQRLLEEAMRREAGQRLLHVAQRLSRAGAANPAEHANTCGRFPSDPGTTATRTGADPSAGRCPWTVWSNQPRQPRRKNRWEPPPRRTIGTMNRRFRAFGASITPTA